MAAEPGDNPIIQTGDPLGQWQSCRQGWEESKLWDLADYINGRAFKAADFADHGLHVIKITELKYGISDETASYPGEVDQKHLIRDGDVLFAWSGNPETSLDAHYWRGNDAVLNQHIFRVVPKRGIDKKYLYYLLKYLRPTFIRTARDKATSMGHVKVSDLKRLIAKIPPTPVQTAIGEVLGSLDERIEVNRRINQNLENTIRAVFKSWFVDFDPVRARMDGKPPTHLGSDVAGLFPDSMTHDAEGNLLPAGWRMSTIGEIGEICKNSIKPERIDPDTHYIALNHMPRRKLSLETWGLAENVASGKYQFRKGDILFGKLRPYFHKVGVPAVDGVCSTDILVVVPKTSDWYGLLLGHLTSDDLVSYADMTSTGTRMPRANWNDISRYGIVLPSTNLARLFSDQVCSFVAKIHSNIDELISLAELRDTLLPALMTGTVPVLDLQQSQAKARE